MVGKLELRQAAADGVVVFDHYLFSDDAHVEQIAVEHLFTVAEARVEAGVGVRVAHQRNIVTHLQHRVAVRVGQNTVATNAFNIAAGLAVNTQFAQIFAIRPTFGYIPQGALNMVKEFGLMVFMAGVGLSAGAGINNGLGAVGGQMLAAGLIVSLVPVVICFLFGAYVLRMNRAMLFGAMMGARTCAPAMEIISDTARSNIPALGYAGTYAIANVLLTLAGTLIVIIWPGLQ